MDEHRPMVVHAVLGDRLLDRLERLIGRGVAVHVHVDLEVGRPEAIEGRLEDLVGDLAIGPVFSGLAWGIGGIGLVHPGGVEATVEPELHPAEAHPIDVALVEIGPGREQPRRHVAGAVGGLDRFSHPVSRCQGVVDSRILRGDVEIDGERVLFDCLENDADVVAPQAEPRLHRRRLAVTRPALRGAGDRGGGELSGERRTLAPDGIEGRLFHRPEERLAVGAAGEEAPRGIGRIGIDPCHLEELRIAGPGMAGAVDDHHRDVGRDPIELRARRRPLLGHQLRLIAKADDPSPRRHLVSLSHHSANKLGDVLRAEEVGIDEVLSEIDHVAVGVDEPRQEGVAGEVDLSCRGARVPGDIGLPPHGEDHPILHGERLGIFRARAPHGEDRPGAVDRIGRLGAGSARGGEQREEKNDVRGDETAAHETNPFLQGQQRKSTPRLAASPSCGPRRRGGVPIDTSLWLRGGKLVAWLSGDVFLHTPHAHPRGSFHDERLPRPPCPDDDCPPRRQQRRDAGRHHR